MNNLRYRHILLFTLFLNLILSEGFAAKTCITKGVRQVVNVSFAYDQLDDFNDLILSNVKKDRENFKKINKVLYGAQVKTEDITDLSLGISSIGQKTKKEAFLSKLKSIYKSAPKSSWSGERNVALNYAGHGSRCKTKSGKTTWCLVIPSEGLKLLDNKYDEEGAERILKLDEQNSDYYVTAEELLEVFPAKKIILDSCHSGQMAIAVKEKFGKHSGNFVFASSLGTLMSQDNEDGGLLISALASSLNSSDKDFCKMDLDKNGTVSEGEAFASIFANNTSEAFKRLNLDVNSLPQIETTGDSTRFSQLSMGNPGNTCFAKPNKGTCQKNIKPEDIVKEPLCNQEVRRLKTLNDNTRKIFTDHNYFKDLFSNTSGKGSDRSIIRKKLKSCFLKNNLERRSCSVTINTRAIYNPFFGNKDCSCQKNEENLFSDVLTTNKNSDKVMVRTSICWIGNSASLKKISQHSVCPDGYISADEFESFRIKDMQPPSDDEVTSRYNAVAGTQLKQVKEMFSSWINQEISYVNYICEQQSCDNPKLGETKQLESFILNSVAPLFHSR